ncbi:hypothetical protein AB4305_24220 [Nocardia sp. 2YAB30]|uniref:hypothetical protein n=1 Tax=unclassified Nocardia TaxID=2637762 RepID=UPI003F998E70
MPSETHFWRQAFCRLYETRVPIVPLGKIMHWRAVVDALGVETPTARDLALVADDYFYRPHSSAPTAAELDAHRHEGAIGGAQWLLYPVVRRAGADLSAPRGFVELPWFVEAEFVVRDSLDRDLRRLLGGSRLRELSRLVRRADEHFEWEVATGAQVDDETLVAFDRLHQLNLTKYGHSRNHFSLSILRDIAISALRERVCVFLHRRQSDGALVQAVLAMHYPESKTLEVLVQGIDHTAVARSQNLYAVALYRIYRWGLARDIHRFNLGRGAQLAKLNLGANRFHVVSNHIAPVDDTRPVDFGALQVAARSSIDKALAALAKAADRRDGGRNVMLPKRAEIAEHEHSKVIA